MYCVAGASGVGGSTFTERCLADGTFPKNAYVMDPDRVMEKMPEYQELLKAQGVQAAFEACEMPARELAESMFRDARGRKANIVIDMSFSRHEFVEMLRGAKEREYRIEFYHIRCDADEAARRVAERQRYTSPEKIYERAQALEQLMPFYAQFIDTYRLLDNSDPGCPFRLVSCNKPLPVLPYGRGGPYAV